MGPMSFLTDEEKQNMPKVTKALLVRILSYLKPYWLQFIFVFIAILLSATVGLFPSILTGRIVDEALVGKNMELLIKLLLMAFAALTVSQLVGVLENYITRGSHRRSSLTCAIRCISICSTCRIPSSRPRSRAT